MIFSVIVPIYNVEKYLKRCIESVLAQTFNDFELILVDDGSRDNCPAICDEYEKKDSRIKVIHKPNGGLCHARQAGVAAASGEYVFNLDSDDAIEKDTLEAAYNIINEYGCDIISFGYKWVTEDGRIIKVTKDGLPEGIYQKEDIRKQIYPKLLMDRDMNHISFYLSGKAVKRELITPIQLGVNPEISLGEDLCCVFPCYLKAESIYISEKEIYLYTVRQNSMSKKFNAGQILLVENVINHLDSVSFEKPSDYESQVARYSFFMCLAIVAAAAQRGYFESAEELRKNILASGHYERIRRAEFANISFKSRIAFFLIKRKLIKSAFYFLCICGKIRNVLKKG